MSVPRHHLHYAVGVAVVTALVRWLTAAQFTGPWYLDAAYYATVARTLAAGGGFTDHSIWTYLYKPATLPYPSNAYWQPLVSLSLVPFVWLLGPSFVALQISPILCSVGLSVLAYYLGTHLLGTIKGGLFVAAWCVAGGFFAVYATFPDTFSLYGLVGSGALAATAAGIAGSRPALASAGALAGLGFLTRSDGVVLVVILIVAYAVSWHQDRHAHRAAPGAKAMVPPPLWLLLSLLGCIVTVLPWELRNDAVYGQLSAPGIARVLFLTRYEELFSWHSELLVPAHLFGRGALWLATSRLEALKNNVFTFGLSALLIWLPAVLPGMWAWRAHRSLLPAQLFLLFMLIASTILVPLPASHGTLSHALAALQPWMAIWACVGVRALCTFFRRPQYQHAVEVAGMTAMAGITAFLIRYAAVEKYASVPPYRDVEAAIVRLHAVPGEPVLFDDPLAFEWMTGRPALVLPLEGPDVVPLVATAYHVRFVLVSSNNQQTFRFDERQTDKPHFTYLTAVRGITIYEKVP